MQLVEIQTPTELITLDEDAIRGQSAEHQHLLRVLLLFIQQLLGGTGHLRQTAEALNRQVKTLQAEIQQLKQLRKTFGNSSLHPCTEHPHAKSASTFCREASGKPRGGRG